MNLGKIAGEPIRQYHETPAVSNSKLKDFDESQGGSPQLYYRKHVAKTIPPDEWKPDAAKIRGICLHALVEGGMAAVERDLAVNRKFKDWKTNEAKDWRELQLAAGKQVISKDDLATVVRMHQSILDNPDAAALLLDGDPEVTFRLELERFHVQCRTDKWHGGPLKLPSLPEPTRGPVICDLKSTASVNAACFTNFAKQFRELGYYRQAALYREVVATVLGLERLPDWFFVAVESEEPFGCVVFQPDEISLNLARKEILHLLRRLRDCHASGVWPGAPAGVQTIGLDNWYVVNRLRLLPADQPKLPEPAPSC